MKVTINTDTSPLVFDVSDGLIREQLYEDLECLLAEVYENAPLSTIVKFHQNLMIFINDSLVEIEAPKILPISEIVEVVIPVTEVRKLSL
jgi:hypothetical protein